MKRKKGLLITLLASSLALGAASGQAGPREQAKRIHDRLAGVPPSASTLDAMAQAIDNGNPEQAARQALEHPDFYSVTLKNWVTPWTNRQHDVFEPLNDFTATVIGMIRDELDFRRVLYGDILYVGDAQPAYSNTRNAHYQALEDNGANLKEALQKRAQSNVTGLPADATAGVMTTRAAARAFFIDGTNRAMFRYTLVNFLCRDLEQVKDTTRPADRIRQDVSRSPGGDSRLFLNACVGCHSGMDPMAQAYAYYDYAYDEEAANGAAQGQLVYTDGEVQDKYHINANNFSPGYRTPDDRWTNYWRQGPNQVLGWDAQLPGNGQGAQSMGRELAHSDAFAQCQAKKVLRTVCLREPVSDADRAQMQSMVSAFESNGRNLKAMFVDAAVYCRGE